MAVETTALTHRGGSRYRRLDPHFEAPNKIKASPIDRGSMVRIPLGNERSARVEVRSVAPDANPYMSVYTILRAGLEATAKFDPKVARYLPHNIEDAIQLFEGSAFTKSLFGDAVHAKFAELKTAQAERCPKALGARDRKSVV